MNLETGAITNGNNTINITFNKASLTTDVPVYLLEVALIVQLLPRKYLLIKPTSGKFLEGVIYTITL